MSAIIRPTSFPSFPREPGNKKWGKLTADQWTVFASVILPGALIRLWGRKPTDSWEYKYLENFLHLIHAIDVATRLTINEASIAEWNFHIHIYIEGLRKLFPGTSITIYQHLALHFGDHLRRFGPVHSWRCFPFERYNGLMQRTSTNFHFGVYSDFL